MQGYVCYCYIVYILIFTIIAVFKLSANYFGIIVIPVVITDSAPLIVITQLHSPSS